MEHNDSVSTVENEDNDSMRSLEEEQKESIANDVRDSILSISRALPSSGGKSVKKGCKCKPSLLVVSFN